MVMVVLSAAHEECYVGTEAARKVLLQTGLDGGARFPLFTPGSLTWQTKLMNNGKKSSGRPGMPPFGKTLMSTVQGLSGNFCLWERGVKQDFAETGTLNFIMRIFKSGINRSVT